jgi:hypothetical protein
MEGDGDIVKSGVAVHLVVVEEMDESCLIRGDGGQQRTVRCVLKMIAQCTTANSDACSALSQSPNFSSNVVDRYKVLMMYSLMSSYLLLLPGSNDVPGIVRGVSALAVKAGESVSTCARFLEVYRTNLADGPHEHAAVTLAREIRVLKLLSGTGGAGKKLAWLKSQRAMRAFLDKEPKQSLRGEKVFWVPPQIGD